MRPLIGITFLSSTLLKEGFFVNFNKDRVELNLLFLGVASFITSSLVIVPSPTAKNNSSGVLLKNLQAASIALFSSSILLAFRAL